MLAISRRQSVFFELHVVDLLVERIKAVMGSFVEKDGVPACPNDELLKTGLVAEGLINKYGGDVGNQVRWDERISR